MHEKATPRPWIYPGGTGPSGSEIMAEFVIVRAPRTGAPMPPRKEPRVVARVHAHGGQPHERPAVQEANGRLVMAAVNSYDDAQTLAHLVVDGIDNGVISPQRLKELAFKVLAYEGAN